MIRRFLVAILLVTAITATSPVPGGADLGAEPFAAVGTVVDNTVPIDGVENTAFLLGELAEVSATAAGGVDADGNLLIHVTAATNYFKATSSGGYERVTAADAFKKVIVNGNDLRVHGRRVLNEAGDPRFVAHIVWSPPPPPTNFETHALPECGKKNGMSNQAYRVVATVQSRRVHVPCTNIGNQPGGFSLASFQTVTPPPATAGVEAYGGVVDIYTTPATKYFRNDLPSTFDGAIIPGETVQVDGRYQYFNGAWVFVATRVWVPPPTGSLATLNVDEAVDALQVSPGVYEGRSRGGVLFGGGQFKANLSWTPTLTGWKFSGTWNIRNTVTGDRLDGTISGTTTGLTMTSDVVITTGYGKLTGATGEGTFDGKVVPGPDLTTPPTALDAQLLAVITIG